jgi:multifunctional methyltransferase subunit TRM112
MTRRGSVGTDAKELVARNHRVVFGRPNQQRVRSAHHNKHASHAMKLLTHNLLRSTVKQAKTGYPLGIEATAVEVQPAEFNAEFTRSMLDRIDWDAFRRAASQVPQGADVKLPAALTPELRQDEALLKQVHHLLVEVIVMEGALICPDTGRRFKISSGIPNLLLREDEL